MTLIKSDLLVGPCMHPSNEYSYCGPVPTVETLRTQRTRGAGIINCDPGNNPVVFLRICFLLHDLVRNYTKETQVRHGLCKVKQVSNLVYEGPADAIESENELHSGLISRRTRRLMYTKLRCEREKLNGRTCSCCPPRRTVTETMGVILVRETEYSAAPALS